MEQTYFTKCISILYRQGSRYYDRELAKYSIGYGQQFYLPRIYENQGLSMYELARLGHFDKGTVTKAVQKLEEQGYLRIETDDKDKRIRRLYTTEKAEPVIQTLYRVRRQWHETLLNGLADDEVSRVEKILETMAQNAYAAVEAQQAGKEDEAR